LGRRRDIVAVALIGSAARGDDQPGSDLDFLVVTRGWVPPSALLGEEAYRTGRDAVSLVVHTREHFARLTELGALFALHVRTEARLLLDRDGWLARQLDATRAVAANVVPTVDWAQQELRYVSQPDRFNGIYVFAFARIYSIARGLAIALTVLAGRPTFAKDEAFQVAIASYPHLTEALSELAELRGFHDRTSGRRSAAVPFNHRGATDRFRSAVRHADDVLQVTRSLP
jgi:predicted nucleotidyltransferase